MKKETGWIFVAPVLNYGPSVFNHGPSIFKTDIKAVQWCIIMSPACGHQPIVSGHARHGGRNLYLDVTFVTRDSVTHHVTNNLGK